MLTPRTVHVAVAVIRSDPADKPSILISKRPEHVHQGGYWEFPGGKVEPGESVQDALARELYEELGIEVQQAPSSIEPLIQIYHDYGDKQVFLDVWWVNAFIGDAHGREGQAIRWVPVNKLQDYSFPAANHPIVTACQLPQRLALTPVSDSEIEVRRYLDSLLTLGLTTVILRQPHWEISRYKAFARSILDDYCPRGLALILHGDPDVFSDFPALPVHIPARIAFAKQSLPSGERWLSMSCHNPQELAQAQALGVDFVTLSPVCETSSHPEQAGMGWAQFSDWVRPCKVPVYALGGMTEEHLVKALEQGAQGIAGISAWVAR